MKAYWTWTLTVLGVGGVIACSGSSFSSDQSGLSTGGTGAGTGTGGATSTGATSSTGGAVGSGGAVGNGGVVASGGVVGSGGGTVPPPGGTTGTGGFDTSGVQCDASPAVFPTFETGCTDTSNCVLVSHQTDCCGSILMMGINHSEESRFAALETFCDSQYPACGCASFNVSAEDGTTVPSDAQSKIIVSCNNGTCTSQYSGQTLACGDTKVCTDMQYCSVQKSVTTGSATYDCLVPPTNCTGCGCFSVLQVGCSCVETNGIATVSCATP